ncbi:MAG: helix-turn-helix domain-containing protein [Myxococcota bacterium]
MASEQQTDARRLWRATLHPASLLSTQDVVDALPGRATDIESWLANSVKPAGIIGSEPIYAWSEVLQALAPPPAPSAKRLQTANNPNAPAPLLTTKDVCARLRITSRHLYALVARNELPHIRIGRKLRFHPETIEQWLTGRTETASEEGPTHGNQEDPRQMDRRVHHAERPANPARIARTNKTGHSGVRGPTSKNGGRVTHHLIDLDELLKQ